MDVSNIWNDIDNKLIAILRGVKPEETKSIVEALIKVGFRAIEIPLNSPDPFNSIKIAVQTANDFTSEPCLIGAGTVLSLSDVNQVHSIGGNLIVSPNANVDIIQQTKALKMFSAPGVYTPSECLSALNFGADLLKVFPASIIGLSGIKALSAVLPKAIQICAVGGVGNENFQSYLNAGAIGFGLGSSLYKSGMHSKEVAKNAQSAVKAFNNCIIK